MRIAAIAALVLAPLAAAGSPAQPIPGSPGFADVIMQPPQHRTSGPVKLTSVSHLIYLNPCLPNGCTVYPGADDSRTDHSSIPSSQSHLAGWQWGPDKWNSLVQCVKDMYAPYDVQITDQDPGTAAHFELMVGGNSTDVGVDGAGGVAPFIPCAGEVQDNVITFVFAAETDNLDYLCWAAAQETSHAFGLDHEMNAKDPMTYLSPPIKKPGFQNTATPCGEDQDRQCWCGNNTQNSAQYLMDMFGPANLTPATLAIDSPANGAWVKPGFGVHATAMTQLSVTAGTLQVDGADADSTSSEMLLFHAPTSLTGGMHTITVNATDAAARTFGASVTVNVTASCGGGKGCASGFGCLGGYCLPEANVAGGLGAACTNNDQCVTGQCGSDGTDQLCTGACDNGTSCPSGYQCVAAGASSVCWPGASGGGGGCAAGGNSSPWLALGGLGALLALARPRRRR